MDSRPALVAVDDGYAQTKLYGEGPDGNPVRFVMRSSVRPGRYGLGTIAGSGSVGSYETEEGDQFTVSEDIEAENTQFDGFHVSTMNRTLVHHALLESGFGGRPVRLITGLPVSDFFFDDGKDDEKIAEKRQNLLKGVKSTSAQGIMPRIIDVEVGCQAVAAWVDYVLDDNVEQREDANTNIAVVDIGGRTTDIAVVIGGNAIDHGRSGTQNIGVLDVYSAVAKGVRSQFRTRDQFPLALMDDAIRTGLIKLWGQEHDVSEIVQRVVREHEGTIAREVERRLGAASNLAAVVFVGGGGALFKGIANRFRNGVMAEDPEFANARGLYKYARYFGAQ